MWGHDMPLLVSGGAKCNTTSLPLSGVAVVDGGGGDEIRHHLCSSSD